MIVVLDTNVLVSGVFFHGPPAAIVEAWLAGQFEIYVTPAILEEYLRVIHELSALQPDIGRAWEEVLLTRCRLIPEVKTGPWRPRDPTDAKFLACAASVGADYLVSGDRDLQSYPGETGFAIVSPRQFLQRL